MDLHLDLVKNLIKIKSYSGNEEELREFIKKWFSDRKIKSFLQENNLIVHITGKDGEKAFVFNSHMDTVSKGDEQWKYGPWNPTMERGKLIGLGASDMKSGVAASMLLAEHFTKEVPPVDIWFTYVTEEEFDGSGTKSFATWFEKEGYIKKYDEIAGIFTEPSSLIEIEHGHRGNLFLRAISKGNSGHSSEPNKIKAHAVREMINFADALNKQFKKWQKEYSFDKFEPPTVGEFTSIQAGIVPKNNSVEVESPNKFPSLCMATFDIRTTPTFHEVAFSKIQQLGKKMGIEVSFAFTPGPAAYTDPKDKIIKSAKNIIPKAKLMVSNGSADLGFLSKIGIKAILLGPGEKEEAHVVNEFCYPKQISQAVEIYKKIVEVWAK